MESGCDKMKDRIADLVTGVLPKEEAEILEQHLRQCPACNSYAQALRKEDLLLTELFRDVDADMESRQQRVLKAVGNSYASKQSDTISIWRKVMKSKIAKISTIAAIIVVAIALSITYWSTSIPKASAAEVLSQAVQATGKLKSLYMKLQIRTIPHDNFELIKLDYDFVPHEIWKQFDGTWHGKWRIEKPGRVVVMDGQSSLLLIKPNYAVKGGVDTGFVDWLRPLLDVDKLLDSEIKRAQNQSSELLLTHETGPDGKAKLVVTVEATAQGDFTHDWLKNKSIPASDNLRIYTFDAKTKLLESLEVYVHTEDEDVLVLEITDIEYNVEIAPALFTLELPEDTIWFEEPKVLADNVKYEQMTPKEAATAFFQACADEDWDEVLKFWSASAIDQRLKDFLGGIEIISIGEPFKSGRYPGWFVPYEIKLKNGYVKKFNLAVRNDNPAKRYIVDGGI